jgi:hypothetical protein
MKEAKILITIPLIKHQWMSELLFNRGLDLNYWKRKKLYNLNQNLGKNLLKEAANLELLSQLDNITTNPKTHCQKIKATIK